MVNDQNLKAKMEISIKCLFSLFIVVLNMMKLLVKTFKLNYFLRFIYSKKCSYLFV